MSQSYFIVVEEWNYPCESGRNVLEDFDTMEEAMEYALAKAKEEVSNYNENCGDSLPIAVMNGNCGNEQSGYIISPKNGTDNYFYVTKVVEVKKFY